MSQDIQAFDPSKLMQGVKERIQATFVSLIPDDHWEQLCQKQIDDFFKEEISDQAERHRHTRFERICHEILAETSKEKIKLVLQDFHSSMWANGEQQVSEKLKSLLEENAQRIFANAMGNMFQNVVSQMQRY